MFHTLHVLQRQCHIVGKNHTIKSFYKCLQQWTQVVDRFTCVAVTWTGNSVPHRSLASDSESTPPTHQGISPWWQNEIKINTDGLSLGKADEEGVQMDEDGVENEDGVEEVATCPHCGEGFANERALQEHILKRGGCNLLWKKRKKKDVLVGEKRHVCEICGLGFDFLSHLRSHLRSHSESKNFKCPECSKTYKHEGSLHHHLEFYHSNDKQYACPECKKTFRDKYVMRRHLKTVCQAKKYNCEVKDVAICPHCGQGFANESALQEHIDKTDIQKCGGCDVLRKSKLKEELKVEEKPHVCDICGLGFDYKWRLIQHRLSHSNSRDFKCEECGKVYKTEKSLKQHLKKSHSSDRQFAYQVNRPHQCEDCGYAFKTLHNLNSHRIRMHTFNWSIYCQVCSEQGVKKGFMFPTELKKHMMAHHPKEYQDQLETDMPAVCDKCSKRFSTVQQLNNHYRKVH